jgi:diguanylate cyclase (GGDEF)-like protein/PAS domain S-box-containing protein
VRVRGGSTVWLLYLGLGALICCLYVFVAPFKASGPVMNLLGLSPVIAIIVGIRRYRPASPAPWWLFAVGFALFWLGDLYTYSYPKVFNKDVPFPSIGDGFYLVVYPALMAGLLILVRRRNPDSDRAGAIDSLIMTLGLALISWVALIQPSLHVEELSTPAKLVSVAYPLGDILLLAAAIRLAVDAGKRLPAFYLLAGSIVALLATDFAYGLVTLQGTYDGQLWLDVGWISFYLLWGAAALHPSMRELEHAAPDRVPRLTPVRLALLTGASLMAPLVAIVQETEVSGDRLVVNIAAILLFVFVVARMAGLVRQQERSVARERTLSAAGAALVAATSREQIYEAALGAAVELAGPHIAARLCLVDEGDVVVAAAAGDVPQGTSGWSVPVQTAARLMALRGDRGSMTAVSEQARGDLRLPAEVASAFVIGLSVRGEVRGLLVIGAAAAVSRAQQSGFAALATEVSLALESAALTEEVHRRAGEARFRSLVQHSSDLITVLDADGTVIYQSPSIERVLGHRPEELLGTRFEKLLHPGEEGRLPWVLAHGFAHADGGTEVLECGLRHVDGSVRQFEMLYTDLLEDENVRGIVLNGRDVSERKAFEEQLAHQAFHDPVTSLPNRALFVERVRHALSRVRRDSEGLAVIFVDIDDFKTVNDSLGHAAGDEVLLEVAKLLSGSVRASDTAARFGGDEYAVLLEDIESAQDAADTVERFLEALEEPLVVEGKEVFVRCSLGISVVEGNAAADADELIRNADAAMYIAKRDGKGGYRLFEPKMHEGVLERLELRGDLQRAMASGQLELHYQPVVRLADASVTGVEALLRWHHPERGLIPPGVFIPLAEEMGLIVPIGRWVLREACRQGRAIQSMFPADPPLTMSVNLSVKQLQHSDIAADVGDALSESGLPAESLTLEITETVMMTDTELAVQRLDELKSLGVRIAMDDFGTGYSSLSYLSRFPVDLIKMDRSFLSAGASPQASALASAVVGLGETLDLEVVAEGIEYDEQWSGLRDLGCGLGQGFLFARPMAANLTVEYLRSLANGTGSRPEPVDADAT